MASVGTEDMYLTYTYLELDPCKQVPLPSQMPPTQWCVDVSPIATLWISRQTFWSSITLFLGPFFLPVTHDLLDSGKTTVFWSLGTMLCINKQFPRDMYVLIVLKRPLRGKSIDLEWPLPNRILKTSGQLLWSLITYYYSFKNKK